VRREEKGSCNFKTVTIIFESKIYENASHALTDGLDQMKGYAKWAFKHLLPAEKKYPEECEIARKDSFKRILTFIEEWRK